MIPDFHEKRCNSHSIATNFGEIRGHFSQHKIIGLDQRFLKITRSQFVLQNKSENQQRHHGRMQGDGGLHYRNHLIIIQLTGWKQFYDHGK